MSMCSCKYPLVFLDDRDGDEISYVAIPEEIFEELGTIEQPLFEEVKEIGFDGKTHDYMAVVWKDPKDATTKKYDVNDHIVVAGCNSPTDNKGKLKCVDKTTYVVLHPIDEWIAHHMIKVSDEKYSKRHTH
jgi:hypothetical protein